MKDLLGTVIEVGDVVAYPVRRGSFMQLKSATVAELGPSGVVCLNKDGRRVTLKIPTRCVVARKVSVERD